MLHRCHAGGWRPAGNLGSERAPGSMIPHSYAKTTTCTRSRSPSFERIRATWVLTVPSLTNAISAISAFDRPWATSLRISSRSGLQRVVDVLVEIVGGQHEYPCAALRRDQPARRLDAIHRRHLDVHQKDIRIEFSREVQRLASIGSLPDNLDLLLGLKNHPQSAANDSLVVGDHDVDHLATGKTARSAQPPSARGPTSSRPPKTSTRSRRPARPRRVPEPLPVPSPSSATSTCNSSSS